MHGPSRVYDHGRFAWTDGAWRGVALPGAVFYELHVGTFTPEGTLDAVIDRLDHLVDLGVDIVELMPVAAFPGVHGWGYDGVHLCPRCTSPTADRMPSSGSSTPVTNAGSGSSLDVVYNHLGPSGELPAELRPLLHRSPPHALGRGREPR